MAKVCHALFGVILLIDERQVKMSGILIGVAPRR
jgi:hypothetical protein